MRILAFPRDDSNPYQRLLYGEMQRIGVRVDYIGELTPSRTLNLVLLPLELAAGRLRGAEFVHLHWVWGFAIPGADRLPVLRRGALTLFRAWLLSLRALRMRLVWTAHNVLPHGPVFADDVRARRRLVDACDLVIAHSPGALTELAALGLVPRRTEVIRHGPFAPLGPALPLRHPGDGNGPRRLLFFGRVLGYKGVEDLIAAFSALPAGTGAELTIAGECADPHLRSALVAAARQADGRVTLRLERVPDDEVALLLGEADAVVLPFREVTTSGSAVLALCHGRPLVIPALPALGDLPAEATVRYDRTAAGLTQALAWVADADGKALAAMSEAALRFTATLTWSQIAAATTRAMRCAAGERPGAAGAGG
jgi:glycosyltransferase involved in cell wall biosynthesis